MDTLSDTFLTILVVDDNESFCVGLKDVLELYGHSVDYIIRGEDLASALEGASFDAVIMDLKLPGYSGIELAAFVKDRDPGIACIISTGHGKKPDVVDALNLGFEGFIEKPYKVEDLIVVLERGVRLVRTRVLESELRESEERYRAFSESASESFMHFDSMLNFVDINEIGVKRLGKTKEEVLGRPILDVMPQLRGTERYGRYLEVMRTGVPQVFDVVDHFSGFRHLRINAFKVGDGLGLLVTDLSELAKEQEERARLFEELTAERIRVEQEQELGRLKTQFISTATHELRTPVTSILGFLEIVLDDPSREIPETVRKDLNVVQRNANRLVTLTNDLLDVQRITSGRFEINREPVDLVKTLNEVVEELTPLFDEKQQALFVDAPNELSLNVDEIRISQLFINLLRNANKFTPEEGKITVKVEPDEGNVLISVKDTGIGLSEEDIGKLFKPFPGINHGLNVSSTGLGLSIAKGIVELHGGDIWAESEGPGKGSTFFVKIPK